METTEQRVKTLSSPLHSLLALVAREPCLDETFRRAIMPVQEKKTSKPYRHVMQAAPLFL